MALSRAIQSYVDRELLTLERATRLHDYERHILESEVILELVADESITVERALVMSPWSVYNLRNAVIRQLVTDHTITLEEAIALPLYARTNVEAEDLQWLIETELLTILQLATLDLQYAGNLRCTGIRQLVLDHIITMDEVMALCQFAHHNLESAKINALIDQGLMTTLQALRLSITARYAAEHTDIRALFIDGFLTYEQLTGLDINDCDLLKRQDIIARLRNGETTVALLLAEARENLLAIRLIVERIPREERARERAQAREILRRFNGVYPNHPYLIIGDNHDRYAGAPRHIEAEMRPYYWLRRHEGIVAQQEQFAELFIEELIPHANRATQQTTEISDGQSTHQASVHKSVSESALRLRLLYDECLYSLGFIRSHILALSSEDIKNAAAKRCISRITAGNYHFTETGSDMDTKELIALSYTAIHDDNKRIGTKEDAIRQFIEGLYEIQRGYNLIKIINKNADDKDVITFEDDGKDDLPICCGGTFNKLIEKLQGIHPDCEVNFITKNTMALKMPCVIKEEVKNYLLELLRESHTPDALVSFKELIVRLNQDGVTVIWDKIQDRVKERMFDEFKSLFKCNIQNPKFEATIAAGEYVEFSEKDKLCFDALKAKLVAPLAEENRSAANQIGLFAKMKDEQPDSDEDAQPRYTNQ